MRNNYGKTYANEKVGVNGLLYKAGWSSTDDTLEGLGRGYDGVEWITVNGAGVSIVAGGIKADPASNFDLTPTDAVGKKSAVRTALMNRGALQFEIYADHVCETSGTAWEMIRGYSDAGVTGAPVYMQTQYIALGTNGFSSVARDADGNEVFDTPVAVITGSAVKTATCDASPILHKGLANSEGYIQYGIDWYGNWQRHFINGYLVAEMPMDTYTGEFQNFTLQRGNASASMRKFLLYDRPFPRHNKPTIRIAGIAHSFATRQSLQLKYFNNGTIGGSVGTAFDYSALEAFTPTLYQNITSEVDIFTTGFSGQNLSYQESRIVSGTATAFTSGTGNYQDHVTRHRPHFCIMFGTIFNDNATTQAAMQTSIHNITVFLMGKGIIPVWVLEHNRSDADNTTVYGYALAEIQRQAAVNDIGVYDAFAALGSPTPALYRAYEAALNHWNFASQPIYARGVAAEINRLIANPPGYSKLAGGNGEYMAIAAP